ncbi:hypothetical protein MYCTH_2310653 [Thermothelomyces thermophilus ATCC 42464]|uniref:RING-type E3 ubiquitin transferase n=1 Tax=Thermothelomyces thermophilus (strain ATCC 42464 / BCRC 31852 / DSM 1799) TaxID=573729 RepID=G2QLT7_THET4|nr:uncharacterized protein MYCTH_2310653 [Thermothelomyces thermophilus ATCC 42464]AEO60917.1 hypothetical protein MYCTH_2310653 [Thermothelomyces thermophilus ATCC 42464]
MARLKLGQWDSAVADCTACLRLSPDSIKAHYSLSQAHLALRAYDDALLHARTAHALGAKAADKSLGTLTAHVLRCKKEAWDAAERRRVREDADLEAEVLRLLERERDAAVREVGRQQQEEDGGEDGNGGDGGGGGEEARKEVAAEWDAKIARMREVFEKARPASEKRRTVPDWAIDDISFCVMVDPVIVSGRSLVTGVDFSSFVVSLSLSLSLSLWVDHWLTRVALIRQNPASPTSARRLSSTCAATPMTR